MNTEVIHAGIRLNLETYEEPRLLRDGTWSHPARILSAARLKDLDKLIGLTLWGLPVLSVSPELARDNQAGLTVGLVLAEKKWGAK